MQVWLPLGPVRAPDGSVYFYGFEPVSRPRPGRRCRARSSSSRPPGPRVGDNPIDEDGGYIIGHNLEPSVCGSGITDSRFVANQTITAKKCGVVANPQLGARPDEFQIEPKPVLPAAPPASRSLRTGR